MPHFVCAPNSIPANPWQNRFLLDVQSRVIRSQSFHITFFPFCLPLNIVFDLTENRENRFCLFNILIKSVEVHEGKRSVVYCTVFESTNFWPRKELCASQSQTSHLKKSVVSEIAPYALSAQLEGTAICSGVQKHRGHYRVTGSAKDLSQV